MAYTSYSPVRWVQTCFSITGFGLLLFARFALAQDAVQSPVMAYVGTFSSPLQDVLPTQVDLPPGNGRGIHLFKFDRQTGSMTPAGLHPMGTSPSCLAVNSTGTRLYSANETDRVGPDKQGTVSAFAIERGTGELRLLNTVPSGGAGPTYVSLHPSSKYLLVANYFGGSIAVLPLDADGQLRPASDVYQDQGRLGPTQAEHAPPGSFAISGHDHPHAHMISADPTGQLILHADLGLDQLYLWRLDLEHGKLRPHEPHTVALPAGDGPRHFHFHPNGKWLYSVQEEGSTVVHFDLDPAQGRLTARQTISTLPEGFQGSNFCSEILVRPDGEYVYAGNRLHDSIAIFKVTETGALNYIGEEWTRGNYPRSFSFDPSGNFLICCNQRSDNLAIFRIDRHSGKLQFTGQYVAVGNPSIVTFVELD
jgi:6-phosphogluconolactonase